MTYSVNGVQYVAVLAGFGGAMSAIGYPPGSAALKYQNSERLLVFKLGGGAVAIPAARHRDKQELPIATSIDAPTLAKGQMLFFSRCRACHASGAEPANAYPDLWNLPPATHGAFESIVLKGTLSYAGMPSFSDALSGDDVRSIQAFIISDEIKNRQQSASPASGGQ